MEISENIEKLKPTISELEGYAEKLIEQAIEFSPTLVLTIFVFSAGSYVIRFLNKGLQRFFARKDFDPSLEAFLLSLSGTALKLLLLITVASMLGVEMTSFIALLGAAGFAIGMSLQGTLQNFAGGIMILFFRPFKVGDWIEAEGFSGGVKEIQIFSTIMTTADNKMVIIPNSPLATKTLVNYSTQSTRRVDITVGISYAANIAEAKKIILEVARKCEMVSEIPEYIVIVDALADSSVNLQLRAWCKSSELLAAKDHLMEHIKYALDDANIEIPFPQREVIMRQVAG